MPKNAIICCNLPYYILDMPDSAPHVMSPEFGLVNLKQHDAYPYTLVTLTLESQFWKKLGWLYGLSLLAVPNTLVGFL